MIGPPIPWMYWPCGGDIAPGQEWVDDASFAKQYVNILAKGLDNVKLQRAAQGGHVCFS